MTNTVIVRTVQSSRGVQQASRALAALFTLTSFVGAALLFVVQPLVAKLLLPPYGGSATVWSTSSMFFQGMLLLAYLYVHLSSHYWGQVWQPRLHFMLLLLPLLALPVALPTDAAAPADASPVLWLLRTLALMVGLPFAVLATSGPILQKWFAQTGGIRSEDPYFLFAASNLGSFGGLLAYPLLIEPNVTLAQQRLAWSIGFGLYAVLTAACAAAALRGTSKRSLEILIPHTEAASCKPSSIGRIGSTRILSWTVLAFIPASLSLAITAHLSTDVAAMPLLWVVPLAIYLGTFVAAFARTTHEPPRYAAEVAAVLALVATALNFIAGAPIWFVLLIDLTLLGAVGFGAHARLAADRPHHQHLTLYYLVISTGGALGAVLNGFVAPVAFDRILEFPITLALVPLLLLGLQRTRTTRHLLLAVALVILSGIAASVLEALGAGPLPVYVALLSLIAAVAWGLSRAPGLLVVALVFPSAFLYVMESGTTTHHRSFFAAYRIETGGGMRKLVHGTTIHGTQFLASDKRSVATTYYSGRGSIEDVMRSPARRFEEVGVIGLGAGTVAAHGQPGQRITFFEIDPNIVRTARNPREFSFLADSRAEVRTVVGDGRLQVAKLPAGSLDLLVLDAFSSDSIPVHLLTREAMHTYAQRLSATGVLAVHISNRYFDLQPVLAGAAHELGWASRIGQSTGSEPGSTPSTWVVLTPDGEFTRKLDALSNWAPLRSERAPRGWTDDYSSVLSARKWFR